MPKFDFIIGNPPYIKIQNMNELRQTLSGKYQTTSSGLFNLYYPFFELGYEFLSDNGKLLFITPSEYFTSLNGKTLRNYFKERKCVSRIIDLTRASVFEEQVYTAITLVQKLENSTIYYCKLSSLPETSISDLSYSPNSYQNLGSKNWRLLSQDAQSNIYKIEHCGTPLSVLFDIHAHTVTGSNEIFIFLPDREDEKYYHFTKDRKEWKIEKEVVRLAVNYQKQKYVTDNYYRIIFPYKGRRTITESELQEFYPCCYEYLSSYKSVLQNREKGKIIYNPFYIYARSQSLTNFGIKILTPKYSKYPRFSIDYNLGSLLINGYGIYFREDSNGIASAENIDLLCRILNSNIMDFYIREISTQVKGGYFEYTKNKFSGFNIPNLTTEQIDNLKSLSNSDFETILWRDIYKLN